MEMVEWNSQNDETTVAGHEWRQRRGYEKSYLIWGVFRLELSINLEFRNPQLVRKPAVLRLGQLMWLRLEDVKKSAFVGQEFFNACKETRKTTSIQS